MAHANAVVRLADGKIVGRELAGAAKAVSGGALRWTASGILSQIAVRNLFAVAHQTSSSEQ